MKVRRRTLTPPIKTTAVAVVALLVLAACSSSGGGNSSSSAPPADSSPATGDSGSSQPASGTGSLPASGPGSGTGTIKVGTQCTNSGSYPQPECLSTFKAAADYANSKGGINGYKIEIDNCDLANGLTDPAAASQCAKKQVTQNHDDILVSLNGGVGETSVLESKGIPVLAPIDVTPEFDTSPISFPIYAWQASAWGTIVKYLATKGVKTPAVTDTQSTIGAAAKEAVINSYKKLGITPKSVVALLTAVSFQPQVQVMQAENVDAVYPVMTPGNLVSMAQEANAIGFHPAWGSIWNAYDQETEGILSKAGGAKFYTTAPFKSYDEAGELLKSTVDKYGESKDWQFSFTSIVNWIGMEFLFQALTKMSGPATPAKIIEQLKTNDFTSEWLPEPINWKNTTGPSCRIASTKAFVYELKDGKWTKVSDPVDVPFTTPVPGCKS